MEVSRKDRTIAIATIDNAMPIAMANGRVTVRQRRVHAPRRPCNGGEDGIIVGVHLNVKREEGEELKNVPVVHDASSTPDPCASTVPRPAERGSGKRSRESVRLNLTSASFCVLVDRDDSSLFWSCLRWARDTSISCCNTYTSPSAKHEAEFFTQCP
jgi:hypothetical protein